MPGSGQQPPTAAKKTVTKKTVPASKAKATVATGKSSAPGAKTSTAASKKRAATTKRYAAPHTPSVARQAAPSSDRYKEIQQALASKGYLKSEPSGVWDADSVAAMRQFQTDRKLDPSGKLTAASLIDLGLGPKPEQSQPAGPNDAGPGQPKTETAPTPQPYR